MQNNIPFSWSYNPSKWSRRQPLIILACIGFLFALYLGLYQLNAFNQVWEPFFGNGTNEVINSSVSRSLPIPDGLIGAFGYLLDILLGSIGNENRWQTKPWIVIFYSLVIFMMGLVSVLLIMLQPVLLHAWCTLCLASAAISITLISPVAEELLATLQFLKRKKRNEGKI